MPMRNNIQAKIMSKSSINYVFRAAEEPQAEEIISQGRIKWGKDNLYPQMLVGLAQDNPVHGGILDQKVRFITSGGVTISDLSISENKGGSYSLNEILDLLVKDAELFWGWAVVFKKRTVLQGNAKVSEWFIEPIEREMIRSTESGITFEYSDDWSVSQQGSKQNFKSYKSIFYITDLDTECIFVNDEKPKQRILNVNGRNKLTKCAYPSPKYISGLVPILAGIEMDFFTYAESVNGMKGGTMVYLGMGTTGDEEKDKKQDEKIKEMGSNRATQGGMTIIRGEGKDQATKVEQINGNDLHLRYIEQNKETKNKIMVAHGVISPALFGVMSEKMFGSQEEMTIAYELFVDNYVKPAQRFVTEPLKWAIEKLNKKTVEIKYNTFAPSFIKAVELVVPAVPVVSEVKMSKEYSDDEILEMFANCGVDKSKYFDIHEQEFCDMSDEDFINSYDSFATPTETKIILSMIKDGESYQAVAKAIGKDGVYLSAQLVKLGRDGLLNNWKVTKKGLKQTVTKVDFKVFYSYELRPNAPELVEGGESRAFCKRLMELSETKLFSKSDIVNISTAINRDVWYYRGGWYHDPDTGVNTPSCRHLWSQKIVSNL